MRLEIELLRVLNTGASAHHLNVASDDAPGISQAIAMAHCAIADISDDFHIGVGMQWKTAVRRDFVIVPEAQRAPARIRIDGRKMVLGIEPTAPVTGKQTQGPTFDHDILKNSLP